MRLDRDFLSSPETLILKWLGYISDNLYKRLNTWLDRHYRDLIKPEDLQAPLLLMESRTALGELIDILNLGSVYKFQQI
ncbi:hypothetical protein CJF42_10490 [Pseudoalteromonas sp. NBT06-2]|uniref:N-succinylarginine dihydrolase n=1 Tax=Pseudoalteromonas sp. NBT06-2 TaxID=2025950 RepID=UPI000BA6B03C|nr:N-succinylarginine dihydrolase [Pseudoalteromonas sp. NBT06-2]PAJ74427.1 hypothetical protein CJF42_10490 [Pseudoalteromonas sp. NBT06-2]